MGYIPWGSKRMGHSLATRQQQRDRHTNLWTQNPLGTNCAHLLLCWHLSVIDKTTRLDAQTGNVVIISDTFLDGGAAICPWHSPWEGAVFLEDGRCYSLPPLCWCGYKMECFFSVLKGRLFAHDKSLTGYSGFKV